MDVVPSPGDILMEKYRVERILGEGGMGVVLAATHLQLDQLVAIKFLAVETTGESAHREVLARFEREARAAARLASEHVARVFDFGQLPGGSPYIVMEHLDGQDAGRLVEDSGPLPVALALEYVMQAAVGLAEAHAAGIVHRDIKPANLFITERRDGRKIVKLLDFGISKLTSQVEDAKLTGANNLGSPLYMSPEQIEASGSVDHRTDIWSLGTVLYELLTGQPPFIDDAIPKVYIKILSELPTPPSEIVELPEGLDEVVLLALEKHREDRYRTVADFAHALAPFCPPRVRELERSALLVIADSPLSHEGLAVPTMSEPPPPARPSIDGHLGATTPSSPSLQKTSSASTWTAEPAAPSRVRHILPALALLALIAGVLALRMGGDSPVAPEATTHALPHETAPPSVAPAGEPAAVSPEPPVAEVAAEPSAADPESQAPARRHTSTSPPRTQPAASSSAAPNEPSTSTPPELLKYRE